MSDFEKSVAYAVEAKPSHQSLVKLFLSDSVEYKRYVVGKNDQSVELSKLVRIDGIIDDFEKSSDKWNAIPVVSGQAITDKSIIVNCSTSISPVSVNKMLSKSGTENVLNIHEVIFYSEGLLKWPWFVTEMRKDYKENQLEWLNLYNSLSDEESKKTLLNLIRFRLTADPKYMSEYRVRLSDQYFEDFMNVQNEVFVDVGGFDGDSSEEFSKRYPDYKKILFFEPAQLNMETARRRLQSVRNVEYMPFGLSDVSQQLSFDGNAGSASSITEGGNETIHVTTMDAVVKEPISFIKMDIEGWELKALEGSKGHITVDKPKMAIAVYHSASDFRKIPALLLSFNPDYDLYLRHYTEGWSETVMFFKPKK